MKDKIASAKGLSLFQLQSGREFDRKDWTHSDISLTAEVISLSRASTQERRPLMLSVVERGSRCYSQFDGSDDGLL
jgi:hypothetical protein